ncbi:hypothetical protein ZWY2020_014194 [Hordeum vulgare]|nr:hypothetical protein ZWY2020_014194 [Hordeum vulgare]
MAHAVLVLLAWHPDLIVPTLTLHVAAVGIWKYQRQRLGAAPACTRPWWSARGGADEEFDTIPSAKSPEVVRPYVARPASPHDASREGGDGPDRALRGVAALAELGIGSLLNGGGSHLRRRRRPTGQA